MTRKVRAGVYCSREGLPAPEQAVYTSPAEPASQPNASHPLEATAGMREPEERGICNILLPS